MGPPTPITVPWELLGYPSDILVTVRELYGRLDLGEFKGEFTARVNNGDVAVVRLEPKEPSEVYEQWRPWETEPAPAPSVAATNAAAAAAAVKDCAKGGAAPTEASVATEWVNRAGTTSARSSSSGGSSLWQLLCSLKLGSFGQWLMQAWDGRKTPKGQLLQEQRQLGWLGLSAGDKVRRIALCKEEEQIGVQASRPGFASSAAAEGKPAWVAGAAAAAELRKHQAARRASRNYMKDQPRKEKILRSQKRN